MNKNENNEKNSVWVLEIVEYPDDSGFNTPDTTTQLFDSRTAADVQFNYEMGIRLLDIVEALRDDEQVIDDVVLKLTETEAEFRDIETGWQFKMTLTQSEVR